MGLGSGSGSGWGFGFGLESSLADMSRRQRRQSSVFFEMRWHCARPRKTTIG